MALALALSTGALTGCKFFNTSKKENISPPTELSKFEAKGRFDEQWDFGVSDADAGVRGEALRPAISADAVFVAGAEGDVARLDRASGRVQWKRNTELRIAGGVGADARRLVLGTLDGEVIALDANDGEELWRVSFPCEFLATPVVTAAVVAVRGNNGRVYGLNTNDGSLSWTFDGDVPLLSLRGNADLVLEGTTLYNASDSGKLSAIDLVEGRLKWEQVITLPDGRNELERMIDLDGQFRADRGDVVIAGFNGNTHILTSDSGRTVWTQKSGSAAGLDVDERHVYISESDGDVRALDRRSGVQVWRQKALRHRMLSAPRVVGGAVVVGDLEGFLHALSPEDGRLLARTRVGKTPIAAPPVVVDDTIFVQSRGGNIASLSLNLR
jgi:outer membrane protein assembly factor BamB